jgi:hypothetical protein
LARLKHEFFSTGMVGYERLEREAMLAAAGRLVGFYLRTASPLAIHQGIAYPADLEAVVIDKLERWCAPHLDH